MFKTLKILLCADDDGIMVKTIKNAINNKGFEESIVLVRDQLDTEMANKLFDYIYE
jgi:ActR/RegA family two-component response regulator